MIRKNTFNPVPLWQGKEHWWSRRKTYRGECRPVILPTGKTPCYQLSTDGIELLASGNEVKITITPIESQYIQQHVLTEREVYGVGMSDFESREFTNTTATPATTLKFEMQDGKYYVNLSLITPLQPIVVYAIDNRPGLISASQLGMDVHGHTNDEKFYVYEPTGSGDGITLVDCINLAGWMQIASSVQVSRKVYDCESGSVISQGNVTATVVVSGEIANSTTNYAIVVPETTVQGTAGRMVYEEIAFGDAVYVSEPWQWLDVSELLHIHYGNPTPIIAAGNYMPFGAFASHDIYLNAYLMNPPYVFNDEVEEIDGHKFVLKKVSYMQSTFNFFCHGYMADTMRMVWSCAKVRIEDALHGWDVEYMNAPEIDWGQSNHLCNVSITFQSDTIVQRNGEIVLIP